MQNVFIKEAKMIVIISSIGLQFYRVGICKVRINRARVNRVKENRNRVYRIMGLLWS